MFAKKINNFLLLVAITSFSLQASAQTLNDQEGPKSTKENSPYSRFGIGNLSNSLNAPIRGMGGAATAFQDPFSVNSFNPATYSFFKSTTLDFALEATSNKVLLNNKAYASGTVTFSYLTIGIPVGKNAGLAFGLKPISSMYYNARDTSNVPGMGQTIFNHSGTGSMNMAYIGASGKFKGFSFGLNAGYTFGSFDYAQSFQLANYSDSNGNYSRNGEFVKEDQIGGLSWNAGLLYHATFKKDYFFNVGATATLTQSLNTERNAYNLAYTSLNGNLFSSDTVVLAKDLKGSVQMPAEYSFGMFYGRDFQWSVGADFKYSDWSNFQKMGENIGIADNAWRLSLGGEFTPNYKSAPKKYLSLVTYRLGAYYGKDNLFVNNKDIVYMGGTVGASFPLKRQFTQFGRIHTTLDIGQRGTIENNLAREFFVKFTFGLSLNDIWFQRPKYN